MKMIIAFFLLVALFFIFRTNAVKGLLNNIALPFWKADNYAKGGFNGFFSIISSKKSLINENRRLEEELSKASASLYLQKIIERENADLKILLKRDDIKNNKMILGVVLAKPAISPFDTMVIDIGRDKGIQKDDKVLFGDSIVIGKIEEVFEHSSKIKIYSSPGEKFTALIGQKSIEAEAEGLGGGNFMAKLPRGVEISEGDGAVMPSISPAVFGYAKKIEVNPSDSFQKIIFSIPLNLYEIKWVLVDIK